MDKKQQEQIDLQQIREKLSGESGGTYWKGLEEIAETPEYKQWLEDEFPNRSSIPDIDRRGFMKFVGASLALAGLSGCRNLPQEKLIPHVKAPEDLIPGKPVDYASAFVLGGYGHGILVQSNEGKPTKVEGNPDHPSSLGGTNIFALASILNLYDPDRQIGVMQGTLPSTWDEFLASARGALKNSKKVHILTETVTSPTLAAQIQSFAAKFGATWHQYESVNRDNMVSGALQAFGKPVEVVYDFTNADRIVSLDCDIFSSLPGSVVYARQFSERRQLAEPEKVNRLYAFQSAPNLTGAMADHTWSVKPTQVQNIALALAARLGVAAPAPSGAVPEKALDAIATDLLSHKGRAVVVPGEHQPAELHQLCHAINAALSAVGSTVQYLEPVMASPMPQSQDLANLCQSMMAGNVDVLLMVGGNPVFDAPADLKFAEALSKVKNSYRLGLYHDETGRACKWFAPLAHDLEAWGDVRAHDGTISIIQPLIEPLFGGRSAVEVLSALSGNPKDGLDLVQTAYKARWGSSFDSNWRTALSTGVIPNTASQAASVPSPVPPSQSPKASSGMEVVFLPDPTIFDGRYANNGWLQETPKPLTKLMWDNAVHMSPKTAEALGVKSEDKVEVAIGNAKVTGPAWIQPGHADDVLTLHLGYGRTAAGKVGNGTGFGFEPLRTSNAPWIATGVAATKVGGKFALASSQMHHSLEGRDIVREGTLEHYLQHPALEPEGHHELDDPKMGPYYNLTEEQAASGEYDQWGLAIDLNTCIGCNVCTVACQAENNIPTVGKVEASRGREMHWIRIDRYYRVATDHGIRDPEEDGFYPNPHGAHPKEGEQKPDVLDPNRVQTVFMPLPCMHCETAPCEPVCPVAATVHSQEGLNQMVYNRCVGTRYCSNNCPYKVRRFNYYNYQVGATDITKETGNRNFRGTEDMPLLRLMNNPNVTVRSRGVMEKCTYCVQRINVARINAKKEGRPVADGEIVTACQQACPTQAITFGNIANRNSKVAKLKAEKRNYSLLKHLNTVPRTTYLGKVRNPNPEVNA